MIPPQNVSERAYRQEVIKRLPHCRQVIQRYQPMVTGTIPLVRLIVLSCKRPLEFMHLMESLRGLKQERVYFSTLLVDNGSGYALINSAERAGFFDSIVAHPQNIGMGAAINNALERYPAEFILFVEDDLVLVQSDFLWTCLDIFREFQEIGIIKLKRKDNWDTMYPYRRVGPTQTTSVGMRFHPWLPSLRWTFRWGQRPWYPVGIHNVWSLGPVMFRWCAWKECGPIPSGQGRGQAIAAEEEYALKFNRHWLAARPVDFAPFSQLPTPESPGFRDEI